MFSAVTGVLNDDARDLENPTFLRHFFPFLLLLILLLLLTTSFQTLEIYHFRTLLLPFLPSSYFHSFNFQMKGFILASRTSSETKLVLLNKLPRLL